MSIQKSVCGLTQLSLGEHEYQGSTDSRVISYKSPQRQSVRGATDILGISTQ